MAKKAKQVKPRKEPSAVTIGNLQREVNNLKQRCAELVAQRDSYMEECNTLKSDRSANAMQSTITASRLADVEMAHTRLKGWQDCAREILELERSEITVSRPQTLRDAIRRAAEQVGR